MVPNRRDHLPRVRRTSLLLAALLAIAPAMAQAADPRLIRGRNHWLAQNYPPARTTLLDYRRATNARTVQVDYMLGTSGCRIANRRGWGADVLEFVLYRYQLTPQSRRIIETERNLCQAAEAMPSLRVEAVSLATSALAGATSQGKGGYQIDPERPELAFPARSLGALDQAAIARRLVPVGSATRMEHALRAVAPDGARVRILGRYAFVTSAGHSDAQLAQIRDRLDRYLAFLRSEYGLSLPDNYLTLYLVRRQDELVGVARNLHRLEVDRTTIGYSFQPDQSAVAIIPGTQIGTLFHELFHLVVRTSFGDIPQWLDEGVAALYEVSAFAGGRVEGLPNWREQVLTRLWDQRPPLEQLIGADWFASDTPGIASPDTPQALAADPERLTDTISVQHATARYFMLYLQQSRKLRSVYGAVQRLQPGEGGDPRRAAIEAVAAQLGPLPTVQKDFDDWYVRTRGREAGPAGGEVIEKFEPNSPPPNCQPASPAQQAC